MLFEHFGGLLLVDTQLGQVHGQEVLGPLRGKPFVYDCPLVFHGRRLVGPQGGQFRIFPVISTVSAAGTHGGVGHIERIKLVDDFSTGLWIFPRCLQFPDHPALLWRHAGAILPGRHLVNLSL